MTPVYAAAPFDHAKADIILRSSDNVDFRVFKFFLSLGSSFFETLFEIPQSADANKDQEVRDGLMVVPVTENSKTLDTILRFCYSCTLAEEPKLRVFKDAIDVLEAARKYLLTQIEEKVQRAIINPDILEVEPWRCFAIARQARLQEETVLSAKYVLTRPRIPAWFPEIALIPAADLLALITYHKKCADAVYALRTNPSWIIDHYRKDTQLFWLLGRFRRRSGGIATCSCRKSTSSYLLFDHHPVQWWEEFMDKTFTSLFVKPACRAAARAAMEKAVQTVTECGCQTCASAIADNMEEFLDLLSKTVDKTISQIKLNFFNEP